VHYFVCKNVNICMALKNCKHKLDNFDTGFDKTKKVIIELNLIAKFIELQEIYFILRASPIFWVL
jgi:hypothetical protein